MDISIMQAMDHARVHGLPLNDADRETLEENIEANLGEDETFTHHDVRAMAMLGFAAGMVFQSQFPTGSVEVEMDGEMVSEFIKFLAQRGEPDE